MQGRGAGLIVTIGGQPGSGKSTVGRMLAEKLHMPFFSMGEVRRQYALRHGLTINELNRQAISDPTTDRMVDELQRELPSQHASFVLDSRLGFHFVPQSVKIFLTVSPDVAASRILATRRESEHLHDAAEGKEKLIERERSDRQRYLRLYGVDHTTLSRYDLVLDSTHASAWELVEQILAELKKRELLQ